jgi:hypothetical protein
LLSGEGPGWRAAHGGKQIIRIVFDKPTGLRSLGATGAKGLPFNWIAAATSVAMSFIAHEGKVSFGCCRPYKPTRRLSLRRSRILRLGAAHPDIMFSSGCSEIGTGSSNSPFSANESLWSPLLDGSDEARPSRCARLGRLVSDGAATGPSAANSHTTASG